MAKCTFIGIDKNGYYTGPKVTIIDPPAGVLPDGIKIGDCVELGISGEKFGTFVFTKAEQTEPEDRADIPNDGVLPPFC